MEGLAMSVLSESVFLEKEFALLVVFSLLLPALIYGTIQPNWIPLKEMATVSILSTAAVIDRVAGAATAMAKNHPKAGAIRDPLSCVGPGVLLLSAP
jgi:hypothetical protein